MVNGHKVIAVADDMDLYITYLCIGYEPDSGKIQSLDFQGYLLVKEEE